MRGGMEPGSTRSRDRPLIDVDSLLPPSPAGARRSGDHFFRFIGSKASVFAFYGTEGEPLIEVNTSSGTGFEEDLWDMVNACVR